MAEEIKLDRIEDAIEAIRNGETIIVVDDEDRENEGDFVCAAEKVTPEIINFMATHGRGLICAPLIEDRCDELGLLVFTEIPGWQHIGDESWQEQAKKNTQENLSTVK